MKILNRIAYMEQLGKGYMQNKEKQRVNLSRRRWQQANTSDTNQNYNKLILACLQNGEQQKLPNCYFSAQGIDPKEEIKEDLKIRGGSVGNEKKCAMREMNTADGSLWKADLGLWHRRRSQLNRLFYCLLFFGQNSK